MHKVLDARSQTSSEELDGLRQQHQDLEKRLAMLDRHLSLTTAEQAERASLKKEKLRVKDRIVLLTAALGQPH